MSTIIKELIAKFSSDTSGLESGAEKAGAAIKKFSVAAAAAVAATATAFGVLAVRQSQAGDELGKISDKFGIGTEALSRFDHAASLAGVSTQQLANAFKIMQGSLFDAVNGNETAAASYKALGLDIKRLINMKPEDAFAKIADALSLVENPATRSALAVNIFGRAGADLIPMLKEGAAGLAASSEEADRFGLTISRIDASKLEAANDAISKIGDSANGAARQFAVGLAPSITAVTEKLLSNVDAANWFRDAGRLAGDTIIGVWVYMQNLFSETKIQIWEMIEGWNRLTAAAQAFNPFEDEAKTSAMLKQADALMDRITAEKNLIEQRKAGGPGTLIGDYLNREAGYTPAKLPGGKGGIVDAAMLKALDQLNKKGVIADETIKKLGESGKKSSKEIKTGFDVASTAIDDFRSQATSALNQINSSLGQMFGKLFGGGTFGNALGGVFGNILGGGLSSIISGSFLGGAGYDMFSGITWNANGNVISGRTIFPSANGMQGAGENGEEGILPLTRVNGKLGVHASGGKSVTQNIVINAGVSQTVRAEMLRLLPQIKAEAVRAVVDSTARGLTP